MYHQKIFLNLEYFYERHKGDNKGEREMEIKINHHFISFEGVQQHLTSIRLRDSQETVKKINGQNLCSKGCDIVIY